MDIRAFQYILCYGSTLKRVISINSFLKFQYILCYGSTTFKTISFNTLKKFQYILCYGSTKSVLLYISKHSHFNTSYVTVQLKMEFTKGLGVLEFQYILCYGSTFSLFEFSCFSLLFQYILCYGSTYLLKKHKLPISHFNTSYVTVQLLLVLRLRRSRLISIHPMLRFNVAFHQHSYK